MGELAWMTRRDARRFAWQGLVVTLLLAGLATASIAMQSRADDAGFSSHTVIAGLALLLSFGCLVFTLLAVRRWIVAAPSALPAERTYEAVLTSTPSSEEGTTDTFVIQDLWSGGTLVLAATRDRFSIVGKPDRLGAVGTVDVPVSKDAWIEVAVGEHHLGTGATVVAALDQAADAIILMGDRSGFVAPISVPETFRIIYVVEQRNFDTTTLVVV